MPKKIKSAEKVCPGLIKLKKKLPKIMKNIINTRKKKDKKKLDNDEAKLKKENKSVQSNSPKDLDNKNNSTNSHVKFHRIINFNRSYNKVNKKISAVIFTNSFLKSYCSKCIKDEKKVSEKKTLNRFIFKYNSSFNPHKSFCKIVKDKENIINAFESQTNNNFYNNYKIKFFSHDLEKRNFISYCFNKIKKNKMKNIDRMNNIRNILSKDIKPKILNLSNTNINKNNNSVLIPSSFNLQTFINSNNKMKIKTMEMIGKIDKNNINSSMNNIYNKYDENENVKKYEFFQTSSGYNFRNKLKIN